MRRLNHSVSRFTAMKTFFWIIRSPGLKRFAAFLFIMLFCTAFLSAQNNNADDIGLTAHINTILDIFTSNAVRGIACIFLIILCIGLITTGRQEPEMFKKFIPWIAGTILFMAAGTITNKFLDKSSMTSIKTTIINE
jgi:type IV secretory pathway VirB2 component (pilin)